MGDKTARIKLDADASGAIRDVAAFKKAMSDLGKDTGAIANNMVQQYGLAGTALKGLSQAVGFLDKSVIGMKPIDFGSARDNAKALQNTLSTVAFQGGVSFGQLDSAMKKSVDQFGLLPDEATKAIAAYSRLTYDTDHLGEVTDQLGRTQQRTGISTEELTDYFVTLRRGLGVAGPQLDQTTESVRMLALANHTAGGERGMIDLLGAMGGQLEQLGLKSEQAKDKVLALFGSLSQGRTPAQARAVSGQALSALSGANPTLLMNTIGENPYDPVTGEIKDPVDAMRKVQKSVFKRFKDPGARWRVLTQTFGPQLGTAVWRGDFDKAEKQAKTVQMMRDSGAIALGPVDQSDMTPAEQERLKRDVRAKTGGFSFRDTIAGQRKEVDAQRALIGHKVGERVAAAQDLYNLGYKGHRGMQAGVETGLDMAHSAAGILPGKVGQIAQAAVAAAKFANMGIATAAGANAGVSGDRAVMILDRISNQLDQQPQKIVEATRRGQPIGLTDPTGQVTKDRKAATAN